MNTNSSYEMTPNSWVPRQVRLGEKIIFTSAQQYFR